MLREIIARRREGKESGDDFLQKMLQRDSLPEEEKLSDEEIMDNLLTLIIAGQSTTAAAMMWSVKFLDDNKNAQETLRVKNGDYFWGKNIKFGPFFLKKIKCNYEIPQLTFNI